MSLILALAVGALWVRSYWWYELIGLDAGDRAAGCASRRGEILWRRNGAPRGRWEYFVEYPFPGDAHELDASAWYEHLGFYVRSPRANHDSTVIVQYWFLVLLLSILPAWWARAWMRGRAQHARGFEVLAAEP